MTIASGPGNASQTHPATEQIWKGEVPPPGGIVVGVDGSAESVAALKVAAGIAASRRCPLHVVSVLLPFKSYKIDPGLDEPQSQVDALRVQLRETAIRDIMSSVQPDNNWSYEIQMGRPPRVLCTIAELRGADVIVVGLRQHGVMDRILGGETPLQVMRISKLPVLAVPSGLGEVKKAVVAIDFSSASINAAQTVLRMMGSSGTLYVVYVEAPGDVMSDGMILGGDGGRCMDVVSRFRRLTQEIGAGPGIRVETVILYGSPVPALVEFAERVGADVIAAGAHGHNQFERFLLGSVSTGLTRNAPCAVLVAAPDQ